MLSRTGQIPAKGVSFALLHDFCDHVVWAGGQITGLFQVRTGLHLVAHYHPGTSSIKIGQGKSRVERDGPVVIEYGLAELALACIAGSQIVIG